MSGPTFKIEAQHWNFHFEEDETLPSYAVRVLDALGVGGLAVRSAAITWNADQEMDAPLRVVVERVGGPTAKNRVWMRSRDEALGG